MTVAQEQRPSGLAGTLPPFNDNSLAIGHTPLVRLNRVLGPQARATVYAKVEGRNPPYSVKFRIGAAMIAQAERDGLLGAGKEIVESTSGNTGIALAFVAAARGIPITLTMPETISLERRKLLAAYGARLVLTEGARGMPGAIARAEQITASDPHRYLLLQQFANPANPQIHHDTTGPEIWASTGGRFDVLVAGVGTGGTISGVSRYVKQTLGRPLLSVAVEPQETPVIGQTLAGEPGAAGPPQDPGHRSGLCAGQPRSQPGGPGGAGEQCRSDGGRPPPDSPGGHSGGHLQRRCAGRGQPPGAGGGVRRTHHRGGAAGFRGALSQHGSV